MLLVLPVPFRKAGDSLLFESQACNGLNRWADNFSRVVVAAPVMPQEIAQSDKTIVWEDTARVLNPRVTCLPLPWAYSMTNFAREYWRCRKLLAEQIRACEFLQFAIGGLIGDWAAVAASEAHRQGRRFAIHTDRVESQLLRKLAERESGPRAWKKMIEAGLMERYHHAIIRDCSAGLWHGQECYDAYAPFCRSNHLIHDIHTKPSDTISPLDVQKKLEQVTQAERLRIVYAGRMAEMKAPLEWIRAVARARDLGVALGATWYGDGELRQRMEAEIDLLKLNKVVNLTGFVSDRQVVLDGLKEAHFLLFTHITPESPRCLLESLVCGTPIVGYDNPFARDLTVKQGGGSYVAVHNWEALGNRIAELAERRSELQQLVKQAATNGSRFNDEEVFRERSHIIKSVLAS